MPNSPSLSGTQVAHLDHQRIARAAILNGEPIPPTSAAILEARGINVGELEQRLRHSLEFRK